jgi:microfibrillar-associated protein 1
MTKNQAQPARYRPGKAEVDDVASEDESSEEEDEGERPAPPKVPPPKATSFPSQKKLAVDLSKAGQQTAVAPKAQVEPEDEDLDGFVTASESSDEDGDGGSGSSSGSEEEDSSEEESSSDDEPKRPMLAPKFISKAKRAQQATTELSGEPKAAEEEKVRKEKADAMLQAHLERDAAARAAGRRGWDDEDAAAEGEVDDADQSADEELDYAKWELRERKRRRRDRDQILEHEREKEEVERRRNLTVEEREEEDRQFIEGQKEAREGKGQMGFMQKYHHKGAFFNDAGDEDEDVKAVLNRDLAGARFEDDADKAVLPEFMQIRDQTKLGKKGRTKYKDLKNEDTGEWGRDVGRKKREYDGLDDRFKPDAGRGGGQERTGANTAPIGERRRREDEGYRGREEKRARYD